MNRKQVAEQFAKFEREEKPHRDALAVILERKLNALADVEVAEWCESCGAPFFEGDKYVIDGDGVALCAGYPHEVDAGVCFEREMLGEALKDG